MRLACLLPAAPLQLIELKNGETYNGHMVQCDTWMNIHLREVICTSKVLPGVCAGGAQLCLLAKAEPLLVPTPILT